MFLEPSLYFKCSCLSNIINELFPLRNPINCDILICGGILTNLCIWSTHASASIILLLFARRVFSVFLLYPSSIDRIFLSAYTSLQILYDIDIYILNVPYFLFRLYFLTLSETSMIFFSNALPKPFTIISWRFFYC